VSRFPHPSFPAIFSALSVGERSLREGDMESTGEKAKPGVFGTRIVAGIIDAALMLGLFVLMSMVFGRAEGGSSDEGFSFSVNLSGGPFILYLILFFGYHFGTEAYAGGTVGKKLMGLKVMKGDYPADMQSLAVRNLLRFVDALPIFYLLGFITMAVRSDRKRIGDIVAGTEVVRASEAPAPAQP
jgi:uncharacterized RDD family membrane protein YckC